MIRRGDPRHHRRHARRQRRCRSVSSRTIRSEEGPALVYREDGRRYAPVKFSVRGSAISASHASIRSAGDKSPTKVKLPLRHAPRVGRRDQRAPRGRWGASRIIIPLTLLLIAFLVYSAVKNWIDTAHRARCASRCACTGGVVGAARDRHELLGVGRDGVHLDLRHRHPGRDPRRHVLPAPARTKGHVDRGGGAARRPRSGLRPCS